MRANLGLARLRFDGGRGGEGYDGGLSWTGIAGGFEDLLGLLNLLRVQETCWNGRGGYFFISQPPKSCSLMENFASIDLFDTNRVIYNIVRIAPRRYQL